MLQRVGADGREHHALHLRTNQRSARRQGVARRARGRGYDQPVRDEGADPVAVHPGIDADQAGIAAAAEHHVIEGVIRAVPHGGFEHHARLQSVFIIGQARTGFFQPVQLHLRQKPHPAYVDAQQRQVAADSKRVGTQQRAVTADGKDRLALLRRQFGQGRKGFSIEPLPNPGFGRDRDVRMFQRLQHPRRKSVYIRLSLVHEHID